MHLYLFPPSSRALGVVALKNHFAIDCELRPIDLGRGDQRAPEYVALNPNRKMPTLEYDGFVLWEANAILFYLAGKRPERGLWPADLRSQADVVRWLAWESAHWDAESCGMVTFEKNSKRVLGLGAPDLTFVARGEENFARFAAVLDGQLKSRSCIIGERLAIAAFAIGALVPTAVGVGLPVERFREIGRWYHSTLGAARMAGRPCRQGRVGGRVARGGAKGNAITIARSLALVAALAVSSIACGSSTPPASFPSTTKAEARVASADGVSIRYVAEGTGPVVVLVHCLGCNLHYWDVPAAELARDHRVVRLDLAGHGGSGTDRKTWSLDGFVGDIRAVVNAAGVDSFTLVGHSASGTIALATARELGDRVTGVVPVDSVLDVDAHLPAETRAAVVGKIRTDYRDFIEKQLPNLMPKNPDSKVVARVRADAMANDPDRTATILESVFGYREDLTMDHLAMPIVAVDADLRPVAIEHNRAHAPQFDARVIKDTGHWLMLDKPTEFASTLRDVVESIESGKAKRRPR